MWSLVETRVAHKRSKARVRPEHQLPRPAPIYPSGIYAYFDKIQARFLEPLSTRQRNRLNNWCALYPLERPTEHWWPYAEGFQLKQPMQDDVLPWLGSLDHDSVLFNAVELALDWTFDSASALDHADEFFKQHVVKRWHGEQDISYVGTSYYSGPRTAPNLITVYTDKICRITGEIYCLHIEWRINGGKALQRAGITLANLPTFDHYAFWKERLLMASVDRTKLGAGASNAFWRTRRRQWIVNGYDYHQATGSVMVGRLDNRSTQNVIDEYSSRYPSGRWLVHFKVGHLLPRPNQPLSLL
jgi:hypothetical protein